MNHEEIFKNRTESNWETIFRESLKNLVREKRKIKKTLKRKILYLSDEKIISDICKYAGPGKAYRYSDFCETILKKGLIVYEKEIAILAGYFQDDSKI
jgi:hypothetical protein